MDSIEFFSKSIAITLTGILLGTSASFAQPQPYKVSEPSEVEFARELDSSLALFSAKTTECMRSGGKKLEECQCLHSREIATLRQKFADLPKLYPHWQGKTINFDYKDGKGTVALGIDELRKAIESIECPNIGAHNPT